MLCSQACRWIPDTKNLTSKISHANQASEKHAVTRLVQMDGSWGRCVLVAPAIAIAHPTRDRRR